MIRHGGLLPLLDLLDVPDISVYSVSVILKLIAGLLLREGTETLRVRANPNPDCREIKGCYCYKKINWGFDYIIIALLDLCC